MSSTNNSHGAPSPPPPIASSASLLALSTIQSLPKEMRNLIAGGLAGMIAKSVVAPIDRIKILYQVTATRFRLRDVPSVAISIIEKEGLEALWKGNMATMIRVFPYSGIQFMVFDYCKSHFLGEQKRNSRLQQHQHAGNDVRSGGHGSSMTSSISTDINSTTTLSHRGTIAREATEPHRNSKNNNKQQQQQRKRLEFGKGAGLTPVESLISGMIAGTISVLCTYPLDLARAQLAVLRKKKKKKKPILLPSNDVNAAAATTTTTTASTTAAARQSSSGRHGIGYVLSSTIQRNGIWGLYRGITPTILGILPYSGIAFTINEQAKRQITHMTHREPTTIERLQCGALSGLFAQTLAYPLEVTRRRMQTIGIVPTSGSESAAVNFAGVGAASTATTATSTASATAASLSVDMELQQTSQQQSRAVGQSIVESTGSNLHTTRPQQPTPTPPPTQPPSMISTMKHLFEEQGIRGFYKGVSMNWVKGPIAFSISFTAFDTIQGWIEPEHNVSIDEVDDDRRSEEEEKEKRRGQLSAKMNITRRLTNNDE
ncbi:hypothetical protein ACHAWU_009202 [Discostella pseudostelligera]|uniref:Mitochondrial carrier n=1 Tax=Discostella pseudostelligera TaxID=259834 RepID=A0ABD3MHW0_9STRA